MRQYLDLLQDILVNGENREDRTGIGTLSVFGRQLRFDLTKGFPAVTTKKLAWKAVVSELLWFLEGSNDERRLAEILHGSRDSNHNTIWTGNAKAAYWQPKAKFPGDLGRIYGVGWRRWRQYPAHAAESLVHQDDFGQWISGPLPEAKEIDQVATLIAGIKNDPNGRRHIISAWDVGEIENMALPPCHVMSQFYVNRGQLSCHMYQRSADVLLGLPFNIASYALFTHLIAQVCDLEVGELIISTGDTHLYLNHLAQAREQLTRSPFELPALWLNPNIKNIDDFRMENINLDGYKSHGTIKADMAV